MDLTPGQLKSEAAIGAVLVTTPGWALVIQEISMIAGMIAAVCGAIVGLHAVWRLWRRTRAGVKLGS